MHKKNLSFYFDFLSPFSYFLSLRLLKLQRDVTDFTIQWKPVVLAKLLNHWEIKAPAEVPPKREYLFRQSLRYAAKNNISFSPPRLHPFNPLYALRLACLETHNGNTEQLEKTLEILWRKIWGEGCNPDNPEDIVEWLNTENLNGTLLMENSYNKIIKDQLKHNTQEAIEHKVFGVPTCIANNGIINELFWGNDAYDDMMLFIQNKDFLNRDAYNRIIQTTQMGSSARLHI